MSQEEPVTARNKLTSKRHCLYLQPFDRELAEKIRTESRHLKVSMTYYIETILAGLGVRGRADAFSNEHRTRALSAARDAIFNARKDMKG